MSLALAAPTTTVDAGQPSAVRQEFRYQLEIVALCGFAFAQPILDVFGRSPETFVLRRADRLDIVIFGLLVALVPPLVLGAAAALTRFAGAAARRVAQTLLLGFLTALVLVYGVKHLAGPPGWALILVAVVGAGGGALLYLRVRFVRLWLAFASPATAIFLVMFLVASPTADLVVPRNVGAVELNGSKLPRHIIFIAFDEFSTASLVGKDGLVDAQLFPNFRALADDATWYRNYTALSASTTFAMAALLTGDYPRNVDATAANYPHNLFTLLGSDYEVHASEAWTAMCPRSVCDEARKGSALPTLTGDALDVWQQQLSLQEENRIEGTFTEQTHVDDAQTPERLEEFLASIRRDEPRSLHFLHLILPHEPWHYYPSGRTYPAPDGQLGAPSLVWGPTARPAELGRQRHLLQVQYVDGLVGKVIATLRQRGIYDDSLVVVTADNGQAFAPGEDLYAGLQSSEFPAKTFDQLMWTPLFLKAPHQRNGRVDDTNVESIDVLPTLADYIGARLPWKTDGVSVLADPRRPDHKTFFAHAPDQSAIGTRYQVDARVGLRRTLDNGAGSFAGAGNSKWALYRIGPYADVVGRPIRDLAAGPDSGVEVAIDNPDAYANVDPGSDSLPGLVTGNVMTPKDVTIVVAVNGTTAGVSATFVDQHGPRHFGVVVPDFLFRRGANDVRLFVIDDGSSGVVLRPVQVGGINS